MKIKRIVALLLIAVFVVLALASCGVKAKNLEGNKFEVSKVSVKLTEKGKEYAEKHNMTPKEYVKEIQNDFEGMTVDFNKTTKGILWNVDGNNVRYGLYEFEVKGGKLVYENDYATVKVTLKEVK